ncbi:MAG: OmpA family protein [Bacteroidota bacterium]
MKKLQIICWILLIQSFQIATSQTKVLLDESFSSNRLGWLTQEEGLFTASIEEGQYKLSADTLLKRPEIFSHPFYLDASLSYSVNCSLTVQSFGKGTGIIWGAKDSKNYFSLTLHKKGLIMKKVDQGKSYLMSRKAFPLQEGDYSLSLKKSKTEILVSLNGKPVMKTRPRAVNGKRIGFLLTKGAQVNIDHIKVMHASPVDLLSNMTADIKRIRLGDNINSKFSEGLPTVSPDGKTLYFVVVGNYENIYYSERQNDGWGPRKKMDPPLNSENFHNAVFSASTDNNSLVVMHVYNADGSFKKSGLSLSKRLEKGWSVPEEIVIDNYYNSYGRVDQRISANGKVMLHSIKRSDSYGKRDIYVSFLKEDGTWTEPKNLGPDINTAGSEITSYLAPDGQTLYFSNDSRPGYGSTDVFVSKRLDDSWTKWSEPKNLGPEVNGPSRDEFYVVPASGKYAYLSSSTSSTGGLDLYAISLSEAVKPEPVILVSGTIRNKVSNEPLTASISFTDLESQQEAGIAQSAPGTGSYKLILPAGSRYSLSAQKEGFLATGDYVDTRKTEAYLEIEKDLYLTPIKKGSTISLNNLFFEFGKATIQPQSFPELDQLAQVMEQNPAIVIKLTGHTDNVGGDQDNLKLSLNRAEAVKTYLGEKGVLLSRMVTEGKGEAQPVYRNNTDEGRRKNRRVELTIINE